MKIGIVTNAGKPEAVKYSALVIDKLISLNVTPVVMCGCAGSNHKNAQTENSTEKIVKASDIVITIGGDGTIIHTAKDASMYNKPLLGINFGRVGFVATMEPNELQMLDKLVKGDY